MGFAPRGDIMKRKFMKFFYTLMSPQHGFHQAIQSNSSRQFVVRCTHYLSRNWPSYSACKRTILFLFFQDEDQQLSREMVGRRNTALNWIDTAEDGRSSVIVFRKAKRIPNLNLDAEKQTQMKNKRQRHAPLPCITHPFTNWWVLWDRERMSVEFGFDIIDT